MDSYRREQTDPRSILVNQGITEDTVDEIYYTRWKWPGEFVLATATHVVESARWAAIEFPNGVDSFAYTQMDKPSKWFTGKILATIYYTSPVGSTNAFGLRVTIWAVKTGEVLTPATLLGVIAPTCPGPGVAATLMKASGYTTTSFGGDDELLSVRVDRPDAAFPDANANAARVLGVKLVHIPAAGH